MKSNGFFSPRLEYLKRACTAAHWYGRLPFAPPARRVSGNRPPKQGGSRVHDEEERRGKRVSRRPLAPTRAEDVLGRWPESRSPQQAPVPAEALAGHANRWEDRLDYFGCAVSIRTEPVRAAGTHQPDDAGDLWESVLRICLPPLAEGTPEALAYEQIANGRRPGLGKYVGFLGRQIPIGKDMVKTSASREEAQARHANLVVYLEKFMVVRRLFHPVVEEMQARRSAFLLDTPPLAQEPPLPGAEREISRQSSPRNERKRNLLDSARHLLLRLRRGRARPN